MENGSLAQNLSSDSLDLEKRFQIALGSRHGQRASLFTRRMLGVGGSAPENIAYFGLSKFEFLGGGSKEPEDTWFLNGYSTFLSHLQGRCL